MLKRNQRRGKSHINFKEASIWLAEGFSMKSENNGMVSINALRK